MRTKWGDFFFSVPTMYGVWFFSIPVCLCTVKEQGRKTIQRVVCFDFYLLSENRTFRQSAIEKVLAFRRSTKGPVSG